MIFSVRTTTNRKINKRKSQQNGRQLFVIIYKANNMSSIPLGYIFLIKLINDYNKRALRLTPIDCILMFNLLTMNLSK
jgi:hypothetical protein